MNNERLIAKLNVWKYTPPDENFDPLASPYDNNAFFDNVVNFIYHDIINSNLPKKIRWKAWGVGA